MSEHAFVQWLTRWLGRHPLKTPPASVQAGYTQHVMQRVRAEALQDAARRRDVSAWASSWLSMPRLAAGLAGLLVTALGVGMFVGRAAAPGRTAREIDRTASLLAQLEEDPDEVVDGLAGPDQPEFAEALRQMDQIILAEEVTTSDQQWVDQMLELLQAVEEPSDEPDADGPQDWLEELRRLDEAELLS